jgi:hypothetical protein
MYEFDSVLAVRSSALVRCSNTKPRLLISASGGSQLHRATIPICLEGIKPAKAFQPYIAIPNNEIRCLNIYWKYKHA